MLMIVKIAITILVAFVGISEAAVNTYVSVLPQKYFVNAIGGERVKVSVMVAPGASPATYEPKPKQMVDMSKTDIYFSIGVPFEKTWLKKLAALNRNMAVVATDEGIKKRTVEAHTHNDEHTDGNEHGGSKDPHIWLDPVNVIKQAEIITETLCRADPDGCPIYKNNKADFIKKTSLLHNQIQHTLSGASGGSFMVFHPSWGYFADRYGLNQIAVELEGKEPKPSDLKDFVKLSKELNLKTIFAQPQFSKKTVELIAKETGTKVAAVDPLAYDWADNLIYVSELIADSLR